MFSQLWQKAQRRGGTAAATLRALSQGATFNTCCQTPWPKGSVADSHLGCGFALVASHLHHPNDDFCLLPPRSITRALRHARGSSAALMGFPWMVGPHGSSHPTAWSQHEGQHAAMGTGCKPGSPAYVYYHHLKKKKKILLKISYWRGKSSSVSARKMKNVQGRAQSQLPKKTALPAPHHAAANSF